MFISQFQPGSRAFWQDIASNGKPIPEAPVKITWPRDADVEDMEFQNIGIRQMAWLRAMGKNILLADEMGLGKTLQACGFINVTKPERVLIICPNNLKYLWRDKCAEYLLPQREIEIAGSTIFMFGDFVIINYEALKNFGDALKSIKWDLIICDEAHYLKNVNTLRAQMVYGLTSECFLFLTGTPIVNYPYEIFPLIHKLDPQTWPEASGFEYYFCYGTDAKYGRHLDVLQNVLRNTIMIRRLKKDVLTQMPPKRRQVIEIPTTDALKKLIEEERKLYESKEGKNVVDEMMRAIEESRESESEIDFEAIIDLLKSRQRFLFEEMARIRHLIGQAKIPYVIEHLENVLQNKDKIVVFAHHHDVMNSIVDRFKLGSVDDIVNGKRSYSVLVDGTVSNEERYKRVKQFQDDENCRLFVGGMKVAGIGITLTAASHAIFAEMDWVPGTLNQCEDRLHRIGQDAGSVLIQHLVFEDSMDSYMIKKVIRKQKSINKALNK